ncbi:unnamed protein product, partial [Ectocarpus sp. 6 AP-2014]
MHQNPTPRAAKHILVTYRFAPRRAGGVLDPFFTAQGAGAALEQDSASLVVRSVESVTATLAATLAATLPGANAIAAALRRDRRRHRGNRGVHRLLLLLRRHRRTATAGERRRD